MLVRVAAPFGARMPPPPPARLANEIEPGPPALLLTQ